MTKACFLLALLLASLLLFASLFLAPVEALAQAPPAWPQRNVKFIVPFQPGSATDVTARLFADRLQARWHHAAVVENRPGTDALAALVAFVGARDDHTLFFSNGGPVTINPVIHDKLPYDPQRDLVPIVSASDSALAVAASAGSKIQSIDDLISRARATPGSLTWAGTPGLPQYSFMGFTKRNGLDLRLIAYRDFNPALQDIAEGRIDVAATALVPLLPLAEAGRITLLVLTNRQRAPAAPTLRTADEIGHPELAADGFQGFFGWRDIPESIRDQIAADVNAVADTALATRLASLGQALRVGTTADFVAMIEDQRRKIAAVAAGL